MSPYRLMTATAAFALGAAAFALQPASAAPAASAMPTLNAHPVQLVTYYYHHHHHHYRSRRPYSVHTSDRPVARGSAGEPLAKGTAESTGGVIGGSPGARR